MTTYATMQARIANELNREDLTSEIQNSIITAVQFHSVEPFYFKEVRVTIPTVNGQEYYSVPDTSDVGELVEWISITATHTDYTYPLMERTWEYIDLVQTNDNYRGRPREFALYGEQIRIHPIPDGVYTLRALAVVTLATLSAGTDSNAWTTVGERLIREEAKVDLLESVIRGPDAFQEAQIIRNRKAEALQQLRRLTTKRLSGRVLGVYRW